MSSKIPDRVIQAMRREKSAGDSVKVLGKRYGISPSTVSFYCRDLYTHPSRIYQTEKEARTAGYLRTEAARARGEGRGRLIPCNRCPNLVRAAENVTGMCRSCLDATGYWSQANRGNEPWNKGISTGPTGRTPWNKGIHVPRKPKEHQHCIHLKGVLEEGQERSYHGNFPWMIPKGEEYCCTDFCSLLQVESEHTTIVAEELT